MTLDQLLEKLAAFEPSGFPFISLYLDASPNEQGRDNFDTFVRKQFEEIAKTFPPQSSDGESFARDAEKVRNYLDNELDKTAKGVAIFACGGADIFETAQFDAPIERHRISVANYPDIYPLARLVDQHPTYAALVTDTNTAHIFVFGLGTRVAAEEVTGTKTNRSQVGGWSQARYQRRVDNFHQQHAKEAIEALERIVRAEDVQHVIIAGNDVITPLLREEMSKELTAKLVDVLALDVKTPEQEVMQKTMERMRQQDAEEDIAKVQRMLDEFRSDGLGVAGIGRTRAALENGQVEELLISANRDEVKGPPAKETGVPRPVETPEVIAAAVASGTPEVADRAVAVSDELVLRATQTGARVTFIEDPALLAEFGGVGALLRFKL